MDKLKKELRRIEKKNICYYVSLIQIIEEYREEKPDISIETCKAILEGISKLVIHVIRQDPIHELDKKKDLQTLFKDALKVLNNQSVFDEEMVKRLGSVVHYIGETRNKNSDISHGRASIKEQKSCCELAFLISGFTEYTCIYMLKKLESSLDEDLCYEDNENFNSYLDEENPLSGKLSYSKALFEQEFKTYKIELDKFTDSKNEEEFDKEAITYKDVSQKATKQQFLKICHRYSLNAAQVEQALNSGGFSRHFVSRNMLGTTNTNEAYVEITEWYRDNKK